MAMHQENWPNTKLSVEGLKRKFSRSYSTKVPTSYPYIHLHIRKAKLFRDTIVEASETVASTLKDVDVGFENDHVPPMSTPSPTSPDEAPIEMGAVCEARSEIGAIGESAGPSIFPRPLVTSRRRKHSSVSANIGQLLEMSLAQEKLRIAENRAERKERREQAEADRKERLEMWEQECR